MSTVITDKPRRRPADLMYYEEFAHNFKGAISSTELVKKGNRGAAPKCYRMSPRSRPLWSKQEIEEYLASRGMLLVLSEDQQHEEIGED